ncbi:MAG: hypothetical protein IH957_09405 [Chloroflexi bacterium]|nr:hypothetical protein [Chloroflexota bacterium]
MADGNGRTESANADVAETWRNWLTETERQVNGFFNEVMGTDAFSRVAGNYMDGYSVMQRTLNQGMERYLNTFNLPTHSDIVELGDRLRTIDERLTTIEGNLRTVAEKAGLEPSASVTQLKPKRTRRPKSQKKNPAS